jgi:hypothetical protein
MPRDADVVLLVCTFWISRATCGFGLRVLWSSRSVNSAIRRPKRILIALISVLLLGWLPTVQATGRVCNRTSFFTCSVNTVQKVDVAQRMDEPNFPVYEFGGATRGKKRRGRIVPSHLLAGYNGAYLVTAQNCSGFRI